MRKRALGLCELRIAASLLTFLFWFVVPSQRIVAAVFVVTKTTDSGAGTLRQAILDANTNANQDTIQFNITAGGPGLKTIAPASALPRILYPVIISGTNQPGYTGTAPMIVLTGVSAGSSIGLEIVGSNSIVTGLTINRFLHPGIVIYTNGNNTIERCFIGTDPTGTTAQGNGYGDISDGIAVWSAGNLIGGTTPNAGNVISGNARYGVGIISEVARSNRVEGNFIGTDWLGLASITNRDGVGILNAPFNTIGGTTSGARNVISGNKEEGVTIAGASATNNVVQGNLIGVDASGQGILGNGTVGVLISTDSVFTNPASANLIGGTVASAKNIISGNGLDGVQLGFGAWSNQVAGNIIGLSSNSAINIGNGRHGVSIFDSSNNIIGGSFAAAGNMIAANRSNGVFISTGSLNRSSRGNLIQANHIGSTNAGNKGAGIFIRGSSENTIGGFTPAEKNWIAFNGTNLFKHGHGVTVESGTNNTIIGNLIWANSGRGIDLGNDSFDVPRFGTNRTGANDRQNYPVPTRVKKYADGTHDIVWTLTSNSNRSYLVEFFSNGSEDGSGFGEGETKVGSMVVSTLGTNEVVTFTNLFQQAEINIAATATDLLHYNTSEFSPVDTDADGIPDAWEAQGIDYDENGTNDLVLAGAEVLQKDIFVEIDTMIGRTPDVLNLNRVYTGGTNGDDGFFNAPNMLIQNPDGQNGVRLHLEINETNLPIQSWPNVDWGPFQALKSNYFGTFAERTNANAANILAAKRLVYRYCIFADEVTNTNRNTGRGEFGGNDFFVAEGASTSDPHNDRVPGTFMHELGHTLGLLHGGVDSEEFKPNYHSVMNYQWQGPNGVNSPWMLDYSREEFANLNEAGLDEGTGIGASANHVGHMVLAGPWRVGGAPVAWTNLLVPEVGPIDWNQNSVTNDSGVPRDINFVNGFSTNDSPGEPLLPCEDWSRLRYYFLHQPSSQDGFQASELEDDMPRALLDEFEKVGTDVGFIQFSASGFNIGETSGVAVITVTRLFQIEGNVSVVYSTLNGTATSPADFTNVSGTLTFTGSETSKTISVPIVNDAITEDLESFRLLLSSPTGGARLGPRSQATVMILDDDPIKRFTVTNTSNSGPGSLRQAILDSNAYLSQRNIIDFNIPGSGVQTINLLSELPGISNPVLIDGYTQPGSSPNTAASGHNGTLLVELNGALAGPAQALRITCGNSLVRGLVINNFGTNNPNIYVNGTAAVELRGAGSNQISGNLIGTDATGTLNRGNFWEGIYINSSSNNLIGGSSPAERNIISATRVASGSVGTFVSGDGILVGNGGAGDASGNRIEGNLIGTAKNGISPLGNQGFGVRFLNGVSHNIVGGTAPGTGNIIWYNGSTSFPGIVTGGILQLPLLQNSILGNSIFANIGMGIVLRGGNSSPIILNSFPILSSANTTNGLLTIKGRLFGVSNTTYRVEFFANDSFDETAYGEGQVLLGSTNATAGSNGFATFVASLPYAATNSPFVTATATDDQKDTSEFGPRFKVNDLETNLFLVNTLDDLDYGSATAAHTSLREAILAANNHEGTDTIGFAVGNGAVWLRLANSLPAIFDPVTIDGTTQPGYAGQPLIYLDGQTRFELPGATVGLRLSCPSNTVRALAINGFGQYGMIVGNYKTHSPAYSVIQGNYVGTETTGTTNGNQRQTTGLYVYSSSNLIGGVTASARNLISFNAHSGIELYFCDGNIIQGNYIGTDRTGTNNLPNGWTFTTVLPLGGIFVYQCRGTVIGGETPAARNVISGNSRYEVYGLASAGTTVQGNFIGTDANGKFTFDFATDGIYLQGGEGGNLIKSNLLSSVWYAPIVLDCVSNRIEANWIGLDATGTNRIGGQTVGIAVLQNSNIIGGTNAGTGNVVAGGLDGILVGGENIVQGNLIGTAADGRTASGNRGTGIIVNGSTNVIGGIGSAANTIAFNLTGIRVNNGVANAIIGNSIYGNTNLGIDLGSAGVTFNDVGDEDAGPNNLQNFPLFTSARNIGAATILNGSLDSLSNTTYTVHVYTNSICHPSGYGEGRSYLTSFPVSTDAGGSASFAYNYPLGLPAGRILTATATDAAGNTSEFSPCAAVYYDTNNIALIFSPSAPYTLSWPIWASDFHLKRATNLTAPIYWQTITNGITTNSGNQTITVTNSVGGLQQYFRLSRP